MEVGFGALNRKGQCSVRIVSGSKGNLESEYGLGLHNEEYRLSRRGSRGMQRVIPNTLQCRHVGNACDETRQQDQIRVLARMCWDSEGIWLYNQMVELYSRIRFPW